MASFIWLPLPLAPAAAVSLPTGQDWTAYQPPGVYALASYQWTVFPNTIPQRLAPTTPPRPTIRDEYQPPAPSRLVAINSQSWVYGAPLALTAVQPSPFVIEWNDYNPAAPDRRAAIEAQAGVTPNRRPWVPKIQSIIDMPVRGLAAIQPEIFANRLPLTVQAPTPFEPYDWPQPQPQQAGKYQQDFPTNRLPLTAVVASPFVLAADDYQPPAPTSVVAINAQAWVSGAPIVLGATPAAPFAAQDWPLPSREQDRTAALYAQPGVTGSRFIPDAPAPAAAPPVGGGWRPTRRELAEAHKRLRRLDRATEEQRAKRESERDRLRDMLERAFEGRPLADLPEAAAPYVAETPQVGAVDGLIVQAIVVDWQALTLDLTAVRSLLMAIEADLADEEDAIAAIILAA